MTSCNTQSERAAGIVWAVLLVAWVAVLARQVPNYNYGDSFGPTLAALGQLRPVPDSIVTLFYSDVRTVLPTVIAAACRALAVTPEAVHRFITIVTLVVALGSAAWAATSVARTCWAGVLALAALPFAWVFMLGPSGFSVGPRGSAGCHDRATASRASRAARGACGAPGPRAALAA